MTSRHRTDHAFLRRPGCSYRQGTAAGQSAACPGGSTASVHRRRCALRAAPLSRGGTSICRA